MLGLADRGSLQLETAPSGQLISPTAAKAMAAARKGDAFGAAADPTDEDDEVLEESSTSSLDLEQVRYQLYQGHTSYKSAISSKR